MNPKTKFVVAVLSRREETVANGSPEVPLSSLDPSSFKMERGEEKSCLHYRTIDAEQCKIWSNIWC